MKNETNKRRRKEGRKGKERKNETNERRKEGKRMKRMKEGREGKKKGEMIQVYIGESEKDDIREIHFHTRTKEHLPITPRFIIVVWRKTKVEKSDPTLLLYMY